MRRNGHRLLGTCAPIYWDEAPPRRRHERPRVARKAWAGEDTTMPVRDQGAADISADQIERIMRRHEAWRDWQRRRQA